MAYTEKQIEEKFAEILTRIEGGEPLRQILRDKDLPSTETFYKWLENDKEENEERKKSKRYVRACNERAEKIFEEILDIADDGTNDYMTITKGDKEYNVEDREVVNRSKLRVDARKWMLGKMNPKKYSDKIQVDNSEFKEQPLFPDLD